MKHPSHKILLLLSGLLLSVSSFAQTPFSFKQPNGVPDASVKIAPLVQESTLLHGQQPGNNIQTLWDVNLTFDPTDQTGLQGWAGIVYAKGRIFCSKWNGTDTLAVFDSTGNFLNLVRIPGIGQVRGMTFDGTNIWAGNNTRFVQVINPTTLTKVRQCTVTTAVGNVRWITFNPEGNNGAGSFYVGNFGTALFQVQRPAANVNNMASINNIASSVHGLTAMYGVAYEADGNDSKFWVNAQSQPEGNAVVVQLDATGAPTGVRRNMDQDLAPGGLAGGIFLGLVGGFPDPTLLCMNQGIGVVGYDIKVPGVDAQFDSIGTANGYTVWPKAWNASTSIQGKIRSSGLVDLNNFSPEVKIRDAETLTTIQSMAIDPITIPAGQVGGFQSGNLNPELYSSNVLYEALGTTNYPGDQISGNDSASHFFLLSDSTLAQDYIYFNSDLASSVGIGAAATEEKSIGVRFNLPLTDTLTSVTYYLNSPFEGQESSVSVFPYENGIPSPSPITTTTAVYTATGDDNLNGVMVTLKLDSPLPLIAGDYMIAVNELGDSTCGIGSIIRNFKPKTFYVKWTSNNAGQWTDLGNFSAGLRRAVAIYPNFGNSGTVTNLSEFIPPGTGVSIHPNPATNQLFLLYQDAGSVFIRIRNQMGVEVLKKEVVFSGQKKETIDIESLNSGIFLMEVNIKGRLNLQKFIKQ
jgi:hypothetical protein